jgi:hypothetical protein
MTKQTKEIAYGKEKHITGMHVPAEWTVVLEGSAAGRATI